MTRLWSEGVEIEVRADGENQPLTFRWASQAHRVTEIANRWRVHTCWWRNEIRREYFKVLTGLGVLCTLYHDLLTDHWYLERVYD